MVSVECASRVRATFEADARRCWFPCQLELPPARRAAKLGFAGGSLFKIQCGHSVVPLFKKAWLCQDFWFPFDTGEILGANVFHQLSCVPLRTYTVLQLSWRTPEMISGQLPLLITCQSPRDVTVRTMNASLRGSAPKAKSRLPWVPWTAWSETGLARDGILGTWKGETCATNRPVLAPALKLEYIAP